MSHGLASRTAAEARVEAATELAAALIGNAKRTPEIWFAALAAADAILAHHAVQRARHAFFAAAHPDKPKDTVPAVREPKNSGVSPEKGPAEEDSVAAALEVVEASRRAFAGLDEYERKALSRRSKLIIRLDYVLHEALRSTGSTAISRNQRQESKAGNSPDNDYR